jgi:hypothetical protein
MRIEMVQWSSQCGQDCLSLVRFVPQCNYLLHLPVCASGNEYHWVGSYDSRGCTRLVTQKVSRCPCISLCADPRRPRPYFFASMEDMGHRHSGVLDVICGAPPGGGWLENVNSFLTLAHTLCPMPYAPLCSLYYASLFPQSSYF